MDQQQGGHRGERVPTATARTSPRLVPARVSRNAATAAMSIVVPTATMCVT
jgi:hypothetical protein